MSVTSNILAINTGNLKSGGVSVRTEVLGGVAAVSPEVGGGGHSGLGQRGKEEERSTSLCLELPGSQCKGAAMVAHVQTQTGRLGRKSKLLRSKEDTLVVLGTQGCGIKSRPQRRRRKI